MDYEIFARLVIGATAAAWLPLLFLSLVSGDVNNVIGPGSSSVYRCCLSLCRWTC